MYSIESGRGKKVKYLMHFICELVHCRQNAFLISTYTDCGEVSLLHACLRINLPA